MNLLFYLLTFLYALLSINYTDGQILVAGSTCTFFYDRSPGVCLYSEDCPGVEEKLKRIGVRANICFRTHQKEAVICCPEKFLETDDDDDSTGAHLDYSVQSNKRGIIAKQKCKEYDDKIRKKIGISKCEFSPLIVGGNQATVKEFPHQAAIGYRNEENTGYDWLCGGTLISEFFVLTADHCLYDHGTPASKVLLGDFDLNSFDDGARPVMYDIVEMIVHPKRKNELDYYDIALLRLKRQVIFNEYIRPVCLWTESNLVDTKAIATGWGSTKFGEKTSHKLLKVGLNIINNDDCNRYWDRKKNPAATSKIPDGITHTLLCSGVLSGGKDTCSGDSGGPLVVPNSDENKCLYTQIGIVSFGQLCGKKNTPGVYTRVSEFIDWIETHVWPVKN